MVKLVTYGTSTGSGTGDPIRQMASHDRKTYRASGRLAMVLALALLLGLLALGIGIRAASADGYVIDWSVFAGGGGQVVSYGYVLRSTIGQPAVGGLSGESYTMGARFWGDTMAPLGPSDNQVYLPILIRPRR